MAETIQTSSPEFEAILGKASALTEAISRGTSELDCIGQCGVSAMLLAVCALGHAQLAGPLLAPSIAHDVATQLRAAADVYERRASAPAGARAH